MKKHILLLLALNISMNAYAGNLSPKETQLLDKINKSYPDLKINDAIYLNNVNLYELHRKGDIRLMYTNEDLSFLMMNNQILDLKNKKNLSTDREALNVNRFFSELPKEKAISVKFGNGSKTVAIFTDPDCPYCKQLDKEIHSNLKNQNMTIYYYMNPLNIPGHELAAIEAKKIWCDSNRSKAWVDWMLNSKLPANNGDCKNPVDETKALATSVGFNSTPTIIFDNGYVVKNSIDYKTFLEVLNKPAIIKGIR